MSGDEELTTVEAWLHRLFIGVAASRLRTEDHRKALEVAALIKEARRAVSRCARRRDLIIVDAAAGKSYVGLLTAQLVLEPTGRAGQVILIEQQARHVEASREAARLITWRGRVEARQADVGDRTAWPTGPDLVMALHACGPASDAVLDRAIEVGARHLLLVPCCTGAGVPDAAAAVRSAARLGVPRHAPVRRRFIQAFVDSARTWRLEAAGYETEVVELVAPTVTPHNLLWRARLVGEAGRMAHAAASLRRLLELPAGTSVDPNGLGE